MKIKISYLYIFLLLTAYELHCQILYFLHNNEIISYDMVKKQKSLEWKAPFSIQNVSLNETCQILTFTKLINEGRQVGYYILNDKKHKIIDCKSSNNFAGNASPNGQLIYFNSFINNKWTITLFNRETNSITYNIIPLKDETSFPYCWQNDSVIQIINFAEVLSGNIYSRASVSYPLNENITDKLGIPGSKYLFYNDSLSFLNAEDLETNILEVDGPPSNIYKIKGNSFEKLIKGKVCVNDFYICNNQVFIDYVDYSLSKKKYKIAIYNIDSGKIKTIVPGYANDEYRLLGYLMDD